MDLNILKESNIEYCENMYALSMTYLRERDNSLLRELLSNMDKIENAIRVCDSIDELKRYIDTLEVIFDKIEVIINE